MQRRTPIDFLTAAAVVVHLFACQSVSSAATTLRTIALTGTQAPDVPTGVLFTSLGGAALNESGKVLFSAETTGPAVNDFTPGGIWTDATGGTLKAALKVGDQAPGLPSGVVFGWLPSPAFNNAGQFAVWATLTGPGVTATNDRSIWSNQSGNIALVLRDGSPSPPPFNGYTARVQSSPLFNDAGQTAFYGGIEQAGTNGTVDVVFSQGGGSLTGVAKNTGSPSGFFSLLFSEAGHVVYVHNQTIWSDRSGVASPIVGVSNQAPGLPSGTIFSSITSRAAINGQDQIAFTAGVQFTPAQPQFIGGIWSEGGGNGLELVALTQTPAPGAGTDVFRGFSEPVINDDGQVAFRGRAGAPTGITRSGIWSEGNGNLALVAIAGEPVPGANDGAVFSEFGFPNINGNGRTSFQAFLDGPSVNTSNNSALFVEKASGQVTLIARKGDLLDVEDGPGVDLRTITDLSMGVNTGNEDGRSQTLNSLGQVTFWAQFSDGSQGLFLSNVGVVPEPSTLTLLMMAATGSWLRGRRAPLACRQ